MKFLRRVFLIIAGLVILLTLVVLWMAGGVQSPRTFEGSIVELPSPPGADPRRPDDPQHLKVLVWNIAWAYGWGSEGSGEARPLAHFERNLDTMGRLLAAHKPDIVLLQEVDFDSARSHGMNQAERLARQAGLSYVAPAESWTAHYVPFPYWPPANHFGHMHSGGAILSRYPLRKHEVELLPKPTDNPWWYNLFYLFRYVHQVEVEHPEGPIRVVNAHLEAFDAANRFNQASRVRDVLDQLTDAHVIFGGDLNSVPPESPVRHGYPDEPDTDHRSDETIAILRSANPVTDTLAAATFTSTPTAWFTFPAHAPNRKLDYLFASETFEVVSAEVLREVDGASDHLPVLVELRLR